MQGKNTRALFNSLRGGSRRRARLDVRLAATRPAAPDLTPSSDTGLSATDNLTSIRTPLLSGKAPARLRFELLSGRRVLGSGRVSSKGSWTFRVPASAALDDGLHRLAVRTVDAGGKLSRPSPSLRLTIDGLAPAVPSLPDLEGSSDSGLSNSDNVTSDRTPALRGSAEAGSRIELRRGGAVLGVTNADAQGHWSFTVPEGEAFADGAQSITVRAIDRAGNSSPVSSPLQLTIQQDPAPAAFSAALAASSDTGVIGDGMTSLSRVSITGQGQERVRIALRGSSQQTITGPDGQFLLPDVLLASGANVLVLDQLDDSGQVVASRELQLTRAQAADPDDPAAVPDPVLAWNRMALEAIRSDAALPTHATRVLAMQSIAVLDTLAAIDGTPAFLVGLEAPEGLAVGAAVAAAAARVLTHVFPAQQAVFSAQLNADLETHADPSGRAAALAFGQAVADAVIALRREDGWNRVVVSGQSDAAGRWRPTPPALELAQSPQWGSLTPFSLTSGDQFRPEAPPALSSDAYAQALEEVQLLGSATSSERTTDQTEIARFWADGLGSYTPPGHWNQIASERAAAEGYGYGSAARLLAILNVALADSSIAAWDSKYTHQFWRPITAIRNADADGNPETTAQNNWQPLLITPNHPEYVSGHSTYSAAAGVILETLLGDQSFSTTSIGLPGVVRSYDGFDEAVEEAGMSRIYGGIHFNFSNLAGQELGADVASWVLDSFRTDVDLRGPQLVLDQSGGSVFQKAPILSGFAVDNLSGVAALSVTLEGLTPQLLSVDEMGRFSIDVGSFFGNLADGSYALTFQAEDGAGHRSRSLLYGFQLDTVAPTVAITSLSDGGALSQGVRLTGLADGTGSALQALSYRFNDGLSRPLAFEPGSGAFDVALNLASLQPGDQTLTITARDRAGFSTESTLKLNLAQQIPLTIEAISPADGSGDVGATFRPEVRFSRSIDPTTLTSSSFWAEDALGNPLPATIVAAPEGTKAWLLFDEAMPGSSTITLRLRGGLIRAAGDHQLLDADGDGTPGGDRSSSFTTVNLTPVPGTSLVGVVVSPGSDLKPMTYDDFRAGPDGAAHTDDDVFLEPLAGVKVFILGLEDLAVTTDAQGRFELTDIPAGVVKVAIDGRTASNAPEGSFYPEMVMDVTIRPAQMNTIMGTMGDHAQQLENINRPEVYLPRIASSILTPIAEDTPTTVTTPLEGAPNLPQDQRERIQLLVQPGSVVGENGELLSDAQIGISTVPPELVRDMLPPGLLQHTFDLTIQAPGAAVFTTPLQLTLPNVFNAAPGTKLNLLSFDHTTGRLVIDGTGTVSEDGQFVVSDPDSGVTRPGWHGMTPPGSPTKGPKRNKDPKKDPKKDKCDPVSSDAATDTLNDLEFCTSRASELASCLKLLGPLKVLGVALDVGQIMIDGVKVASQLAKSVNDISQAIKQNQSVAAVKAAIEGMDALKDRFVSLYNSVVETVNSNPVTEGVACARGLTGGLKSLCDRLNQTECANKSKGYDNICSGLNAAEVLLGAAELALKKWKDGVSKLGVQATCLAVDAVKAALDEYVKAQSTSSQASSRQFSAFSSSIQSEGPQSESLESSILQQLESITQMLSTLSANTEDIKQVIEFDARQGELNRLGGEARTLSGDLLTNTVLMQGELTDVPSGGFYYLFKIGNDKIRGYSDGSEFEVFLGANQEFELIAYDPVHSLIARYRGETGQSGTPTEIPELPFTVWVDEPLNLDDGSVLVLKDYQDDDSDGVPNIAEDVVGTNRLIADTDSDGIRDGIELLNGDDPLGGFALPTGVVGSLALTRDALDIALALDRSGASSIAFVAMGSAGVAVVDLSSPLEPRLLNQIEIPGNADSLAYDSTLSQLAIATGSRLVLVDVSSPAVPLIVHQLAVAAHQVVADDGVAYATVGRKLHAYDMLSGELFSSVSLSGDALALAQEGEFFYVLDNARRIQVFESLGGGIDALVLKGALTLPSEISLYGERKLYVGDGILYVPADDGFNGGYATVDVRNPSTPVLLSGPDDRSLAGDAIALTGSGLAVLVGEPGGVFGAKAADLVRTSDPSNTGSLVTRITLPSKPHDVVFLNGFAYVATASGLQVLNILERDISGLPPSVVIDPSGLDQDINQQGIQVQEGIELPLSVSLQDDTLISGVDVLINDRIVRSDRTYPYDLRAVLPTIDENGGPNLTIQIRANDPAGNLGFSESLEITLIPDIISPLLTGGNLVDGAVLGRSTRAFTLQFSEPIQLAADASEVFHWVDSTDRELVVAGALSRASGRILQLIFSDNQVPQSGLSRLLIDRTKIQDLALNPLGSDQLALNFEISAYDEILHGTDGDDYNLETGDGNDFIDAKAGRDTVRGNKGNDRLIGQSGYDYILGGAGHDFIDLGAGDGGYAHGESGHDELKAEVLATDSYRSYELNGGSGNDTVELVGGSTNYNYISLNGGGGLDKLNGSDGADYLYDGDLIHEDPVLNPLNGHWYQLIADYSQGFLTVDDAREKAASSQYSGRQGYLVTITNPQEQDFLNRRFSGYEVWLGGSDAVEDGVWRWLSGPSDDIANTFYENTATTPGFYSNWAGGAPYQSEGYDWIYASLGFNGYGAGDGLWSSAGSGSRKYILIEYGGIPGDSDSPIIQVGDEINAEAGNDNITTKGSTDQVDGGDGDDYLEIDLSKEASALTLSFADPAVTQSLPGGGSIVNVEKVYLRAGTGDDQITAGHFNPDRIYGGSGNDTIHLGSRGGEVNGEAGSDTLVAEIAADVNYRYYYLEGGSGNDVLRAIGGSTGQYHSVSLSGGGGRDRLEGSDLSDTINDGDKMHEEIVYNPGNQHWYQLIDDTVEGYLTFNDARIKATDQSLFGRQGYLATITSSAEQAFLNRIFSGFDVWMGGSNSVEPGVWRWLDGPTSDNPSGPDGGDQSEVASYSNWSSGHPYAGDGYDNASVYLYDNADGYSSYYGKWQSALAGQRRYVLIEYGGVDGDTEMPVNLSGDVLLAGGGDDAINSKGDTDEIDGGEGDDRLTLDVSKVEVGLNLSFADPAAKQSLPGGGSIVNVETVSVRAGRGHDTIIGGSTGQESLYGGKGNDVLDLTTGGGYANGEGGNDHLSAQIAPTDNYASYVLDGGLGDDALRVSGGAPSEYRSVSLNGGGGYDELQGSDGSDSLDDGDKTHEEIVFNPLNQHWYQLLIDDESGSIRFADALAKAQNQLMSGRQGYLATITSREELNFLGRNFNGYNVWMGASDAEEEGVWRWMNGPLVETESAFYGGESAEPFSAGNWSPGHPYVYGDFDHMSVYLSAYDGDTSYYGKWQNVSADSRQYLLIEYGDSDGDPTDPVALRGDELFGGGGDDSLRSRGPTDQIDGGAGLDYLDVNLSMLDAGVTLSLADPTIRQGLPGGGSIVNVERFSSLITGSGDDHIVGGVSGYESFSGGDGDDVLDLGGDGGSLSGDAGDDTLLATISAGDSYTSHSLFGGTGNDLLSVSGGSPGQSNYIYLNGGGGQDQLSGSATADILDDGDNMFDDIIYNPVNQHWYQLIDDQDTGYLVFEGAQSKAASQYLSGRQGYLVTITTPEEQSFLNKVYSGLDVWLGGTDEEQEGVWRWLGGPSVETDAPFYGGEPSSSESYSNWETGQPYTYDSYDYASVYLHDSATDAGSYYGKWYSVSQSTRKYVLIEYGGSAGDEQGPVVLSGDRLLGGDGDDRLVAKGSADMVDGGAGADRLDLDLRRSADPLSITFADPAVPQTLPGGGSIVNVESFRIQAGIGNDVIVGGALADELFAGFGNDILDGGLGPDVLTGGPGADLFRFSSLAASTGEADFIQDFSVTEGDRIQLPASVFPGLGEEGVLAPERFHVGSAPTAATHRILYNPGDGILFYVADPLSAQVVPFGRAISGLPLTADQFLIS